LALITVKFGYWPENIPLAVGQISIEPLPDFEVLVSSVNGTKSIEGDWIYAPFQQSMDLGGTVRTLPYPARIFGLPKTHALSHANPDGPEHIAFHLWALSFFKGIRLTAEIGGFLDATPIKSGKLVDFIMGKGDLKKAIEKAEVFWISNRSNPQCAKLFSAIVHALFLAQNPRLLHFEQFILLYTAFDACFALARVGYTGPSVKHADRVKWMCAKFGMATPDWADPSVTAGPNVPSLRNATLHEALFMNQPLGFAVMGLGTNQNLILEMSNVICRFLVAVLGSEQSGYVASSLDTRMHYSLSFS
jgi:hypothetical protein